MGPGDGSRQRMLETAREHFLARSYRRATLREIARDAQVTTGSLYHHFSGKDELFVEVCMEGMRHLLGRLNAAAEATAGRPIDERSIALFDAYVSFYIEERGYFELINRLQTHREQLNIDSDLADRVEQASQKIVDEMVKLVRQAAPGLSEAETKQRVLLAVGMGEGLVSCDRRGLLGRFGLTLGSFRGTILRMFQELIRE